VTTGERPKDHHSAQSCPKELNDSLSPDGGVLVACNCLTEKITISLDLPVIFYLALNRVEPFSLAKPCSDCSDVRCLDESEHHPITRPTDPMTLA
jgi:hypothetical protein